MNSFRPIRAKRLCAAIILASSTLALTGCQDGALYRTVHISPAPSPEFTPDAEESAGINIHFGAAAFKFTCAADSVGDGARGTAALICTWHFSPWW